MLVGSKKNLELAEIYVNKLLSLARTWELWALCLAF